MYPIKIHIWLRSDAKKIDIVQILFFKHVQRIPICASVNAALVPNWLKGTAILKGIVLTKIAMYFALMLAQTCETFYSGVPKMSVFVHTVGSNIYEP